MITYRVSGLVRDCHRLKSLARRERQACAHLSWPLALAEDASGHLVAGIGTDIAHGLVIGEPLVLDRRLGRRAWVIAYRLGETYDDAMATLGIRAYYGHVPAGLTQYQYVLERLGFVRVPVPEDPGVWYRREAGGLRQVLASSHAVPVDGLRQRLQAARDAR